MSKSKQTGTRFESALVAYLRENGVPHAERRATSGANDRGDIAGVPGVVFEAKATAKLDVAGFMAEAAKERDNDDADIGVVVWKRRQKPIGQAAVILPLEDFVFLLEEAEYIG